MNPNSNFSRVLPVSLCRLCRGSIIALAWTLFNIVAAHAATYTLGTSSLLVGPASGSNSVVLGVVPGTATWTATTNANWLHLAEAFQSGTGSTNVIFNYDANPGTTRTAALTIAGQTLAVTQAGSTYVLAGAITVLASELSQPQAVAVDGAGNVYSASFTSIDGGTASSGAIYKWSAASNALITLASSTSYYPLGVGVDSAANVYFADYNNGYTLSAIYELNAANNRVTALVSSGLNDPYGVAVDGVGNVYIADSDNNAIKEWMVANSNVVTLVSTGLNFPVRVAVDVAGNVYIADYGNNAIKEWSPASNTVTTLVSSGLSHPSGVAVDGSGNVYIADYGDSAMKEWTAANNTVTTLVSSGLNGPGGPAVDGSGNLYIADSGNNAIKELPSAFVNPTGRLESVAAGNDALPVVLPASENLLAPFTPTSDQSWLAISGITNGIVSFSFTANAGPIRTANITLLGLTIPVTQDGAATYSLSTNTFFEAPSAGSDDVVLTVTPNSGAWTAAANAPWLHLSMSNQSGTGSTTIVFSFDANPGGTRVGTITIEGLLLTVTQRYQPFVLGTPALSVGPAAGTNSVVLAVTPSTATWTATANAAWLHLAEAFQSGSGSTNVVFNFDLNTGSTRSSTLTIAGQTLTVTQAGSTYVPAGVITGLAAGLSGPQAAAVDGAGNVYIGSGSSGAIYKWSPANNSMTTLVSSASYYPTGVAVDSAGNVYFANFNNGSTLSAIYEWTAANSNVTTLVASGLNNPHGVAVDVTGNVYIADSDNNAIKEWTVANGNVITLVSTGLNFPARVAVDVAGNVYIADYGNSAVKEWKAANNTVVTLVSSGLNRPSGVAVDGSGNVYIADYGTSAFYKWTAANDTLTTLVASGLNGPGGPAVDGLGNVYIADTGNGAIKELPFAFLDPTLRPEGLSAGNDELPVVLPATENLLGPFSPSSDQPWLTISGFANDVVGFSFTAAASTRTGYITLLGQTIPVVQDDGSYFFSLGTASLLVGPNEGSDSVVLAVNPYFSPWTNMANASWLHFSAANQSGTGSTNVIFTYDANPGATRSGTLTIGNQTLTVTQAGSTYVAASFLAPLVSSGLNAPVGVAVDGTGNVYIADTGNNAIKKWTAANNTVTTLVSSGLSDPNGVAVDISGNVFIVDSGDSTIKEWTAANNTLATLVSSGLHSPTGVAVDGADNVYIADYGNNAIKEWTKANSNVVTLVSSGLSDPYGVAVDVAGNVYTANAGNDLVQEWTSANQIMTTVVSLGQDLPSETSYGVGVDGSGDVYVAAFSPYGPAGVIQEWQAATGGLTTLDSSGLKNPSGVAVDGEGNVYVAAAGNNAIDELPHAFVDPTSRSESLAAGYDALPVVLPSTANLQPPFAPTSSQPWLIISGVTNGVVSFSFLANTGLARTADISLLGLSIPVTQSGPIFDLGASALLVGPAAGSNSVVLAVVPNIGAWTATTNAAWLHLSLANQSGTGGTNLIFSYDANPGATRSGTLTIAGQTLTITQAGSTYVAAEPLTTLVSSGLAQPQGLAIDGSGNVYIADTENNTIEEWTVTNNTLTTLVSGLNGPTAVAVDGLGNVYIADTLNNAIKERTAANSNVITLVSGLNNPSGVAADSSGNVYIANTGGNSIEEWTGASNTVTTLVSGLDAPSGLAVDAAGNVYFVDTPNNAIKEWMPANSNVLTLVSGLGGPSGVAVDGSGNVYIADPLNHAIKEWTAANGNLNTLITGLNDPSGVAVDSSGNVYVSSTNTALVEELPHAFVDPTARLESANAGNDALPAVLPVTENLLAPFTPASDQSWLAVSGVANGVASFSFTANLGSSRTAHVTLLGQTIPVTQGGLAYSLGTTALLVGPAAGSNSVVLAVFPSVATWTAAANATWLHVSLPDQSGAGSANFVFSYDANPGATRNGTLSIAGQTLTVTQAGSTYVAAGTVTALVSSGLSGPGAMTVDGSGNVYFVDEGNDAIKKWTLANNIVTTLVSSGLNILSTGLNSPAGVALDGAGNIYIGDTGDNAVKKWTAATSNLTTVVSSGLDQPEGVAVDGAGNIFIADTGHGAIKKWTGGDNIVTTLVSGLSDSFGVAVDVADNVYYIANASFATTIEEWTAANQTVTTLVSSGLSAPYGVAVDGEGNVCIANTSASTIEKWIAVNSNVTAVMSAGLARPEGVAVDGAGNIYTSDTFNNAIKELPYVFVDPTPKPEGLAAGTDSLPVVLPATANLLSPFTPVSDQAWLTIGGVTNGVVNFSFTSANSNRIGHIFLLGQTIPVTQGGPTYSLGTTALLLGAGAANGSVVLGVNPSPGVWTATANAAWLHLTPANQSGTGSTNVVFSLDANPSGTRSGTLTIGGQTLTISQAGSTYVPAGIDTVLASGLSDPQAVAVDGAGNVYVAGGPDGTIHKWVPTNNALTTLTASTSYYPTGVAVDGAGNVYFANFNSGGTLSAIYEWVAASNSVTALVSSGLNDPHGVAVDGAGNVYIADTGNQAIKKWTPATSNVTTLVSTGLTSPVRVAVDNAGNVYIADTGNSAIKKWTAANNTVTILASGFSSPYGVAVDGAGNVYIADGGANAIYKWSAASNTVTTLVFSGLNQPGGPAVDASGNLYITDTGNNAIKELPYAFVDPTLRLEGLAAGSDALPVVLPATQNLLAPFAPTVGASWLTLTGITNGMVGFSFAATASNRTGYITLLGQTIPVAQGVESFTYSLGTTAILAGPGAGNGSVVLGVNPYFGPWTNSANTTWLHLSPANQSGADSTNIVFSYDENPETTRSGTLTIAGQNLTVTQAGSTYVPAGSFTGLASGLSQPQAVAVDGAGSVYIADAFDGAICEWSPTNGAITTLASSTSYLPTAVAVDSAGNVYFANEANDVGTNAIYEWTAANKSVTALVSTGLNGPYGVAVDGSGNVYIADSGNNAIKEWSPGSSNVVTLVSAGLNFPTRLAVDAAGNVYIADYNNNAIKEWVVANKSVATLVSGLNHPSGVAVDGSGNLYFADYSGNAMQKWTAVDNTLTTLATPGLNGPGGPAVDALGNVYIADTGNGAIKELPFAFVDPTLRLEGLAAGSDALPVVLPATENLLPPFAPGSDETWLGINGISNDIVSFSFAAAPSNRVGYLTLLGQIIPVAQSSGTFTYSLGTDALLVGPGSGSNSVMLVVNPFFGPWTNSANASWLHLSPANQIGTASTDVVFSYDANSGTTRLGTLTIAGETLTITQAGSTYVPAGTNTMLASGLSDPEGLTVDAAGNVYIAGGISGSIYKWSPTNNALTTLATSSSYYSTGIAVDGQGNLYWANYGNGQTLSDVYKWTAASNSVAALVSSGLNQPHGVAVDGLGNVYIADSGNNAVKELAVGGSNVITLVSAGLNFPARVAVDVAGNVYIADYGNSAVKEWMVTNNTVVTLVSSGLNHPSGVAVDGSGNVYIADYSGNAMRKWTPANNTLTTLATPGLNGPGGPALDGLGNLYIADTGNGAIKELPFAFVDPSAKFEGLATGTDSLPVVLPATENLLAPFAPSSDEAWLGINGISNDIVSFSFTTAPSNRSGHLTLLGQTILVTQNSGTFTYSLGTDALLVGPNSGTNSVILVVNPFFGLWTNSANASWLHLNPANQSGIASTDVVFSYDANSGTTRLGTLTIAGGTLTVTQAGSTYVPAGTNTVLALGLSDPEALTVDAAGNVYIAGGASGSIYKWSPTNNALTQLVASSSYYPTGIAVDGPGNLYWANYDNGQTLSAVYKWTAANNSVAALVSSGLNQPHGVAVDGLGNIYIADSGNNAVKELAVGGSNVIILVSAGLNFPARVAVDVAGNVYIADYGNSAVKEWMVTNNTVVTLVSSGLNNPSGVAVDGSGNVYIADFSGYAMRKWTPANNTLTTLPIPGLNAPGGPALDGLGNLYIADTGNGAIKELPFAFVDPSAKFEGLAAGADSLPGVLPVTENLLAPFSPETAASWLTISGITNGVVSFSFTADTGAARMARIRLLDQNIPITQAVIGTPPTLTGLQVSSNGVFRFAFTNVQGGLFTVLSTTNLSLPFSNWTVVGTASNIASNMFQFTSQPTTNDPKRFYGVQSP
jgi:DNA-binding beta-propeller fold protein YncE